MDTFEKVEKLRERANVSFEEAKEALEHSNGDLLEAMIYLEKNGKTVSDGTSSYSTSYEDAKELPKVVPQPAPKDGFFKRIGRIIKKLAIKSTENFLVVEKNGSQILKMPVWVMILILLVAWYASIILLIVSLFLGCRFSFVGKDDLSKVNDVMGKASDLAINVKDKVVEMSKED